LRKLPEDRPELLAQFQHAGRKEIRQRNFNVAQLLHLRDESPAFDRINKIAWRLIAPMFVIRWLLKRIERAVDFDGVEYIRGILQLTPLRQAARIKQTAPHRIVPTRNADA